MTSTHSILCLDDEIDNVEALKRLFRKKFQVLTATSGSEALELLDKNKVSVIISDQRMPQMLGTEFLEKAKTIQPQALRILLTGYSDIEAVIEAINSGEVYRYLTKPWEPADLLSTVDQAIAKLELQQQLEIKNKELAKALVELQSLDRAKTDFMYLVNHELKTPLTVIMSFAELLLESQLDPEQKVFAEKILKSCWKLKKLVEEVLELISAETGKTTLNIKTIHRESFTKKLRAYLQAQFPEMEMIEFDIDEFSLAMDVDLVIKIIGRIVENAIKFRTPKTPVAIQLVSQPEIKISVKNTGPAIEKDKIAKILKPFTLDEDFMHHSSGTGLGLSLCQAQLKLFHSELKIQSQKGLTQVSFTLPSSGT